MEVLGVALVAAARGEEIHLVVQCRARNATRGGRVTDPCGSVSVARLCRFLRGLSDFFLRGRACLVSREADSGSHSPPGSTLGDQHRKAARPLGNNPVDHPPQAPEHIHIASRQGIGRQLGGFFGGSSGSLVIKTHAVRIWGLTCPGTSATSSCSREPPPRRHSHCIPLKGSPRVVGALRATLVAEGALEELGDMPETKRMSTTADTSAGCGVQSLRAVGCCVCSRGSECRPNLVAASTAIFGGRCETSRFTHPLGL